MQQPAAGWLLPHDAPDVVSALFVSKVSSVDSPLPPFTWPTRVLRSEVAAPDFVWGASSFFLSTVSVVPFSGFGVLSDWAFTPNAMNAKALKIRNFFMSNLDG